MKNPRANTEAERARVDVLSITFHETTVTTKHLAEGIAADYDAAGRLAGIEVLDAVKRFGNRETLQEVILEGIHPASSVVCEKPEKPYGQ